jgi:outer membrane immunogenic protein
MKRVLLGVLGLSSLLIASPFQPASAADLAYKAPPPPVQMWSWTGFYLGGELGGSWLRDRLTETTAITPPMTGSATNYDGGVAGGGYAGYNWQLNNVVVGLEGDIEGTGINRTSNCLVENFGAGNAAPGTCFPATSGYSFNTQLPWQASIRGRLGYTWGQSLVYVTGGAAFADIQTSYTQVTPAINASQSFDQVKTGGTIGGGLEYAFTGRWIGRLEYRYSDFGSVNNSITSAGTFWNGYTDSHHVTESNFHVGLSYLFNGPMMPMGR